VGASQESGAIRTGWPSYHLHAIFSKLGMHSQVELIEGLGPYLLADLAGAGLGRVAKKGNRVTAEDNGLPALTMISQKSQREEFL
jgi:hypothetical protein